MVGLSTGLRKKFCTECSLKDALDGSVMFIYAGRRPVSANDAISSKSTLICIVEQIDPDTGVGGGFVFTGSGEGIGKSPESVWEATMIVNRGLKASWFRIAKPDDNGMESLDAVRLDDSVGEKVGDGLKLKNAVIEDVLKIATFNICP